MARALVSQWTQAEIAQECHHAYAEFTRKRTAAYTAYFLAHPDLKDPNHPYKARDFAAALPESSPPEFEQWLPKGHRHPQHLSGNSSQILALGLLGIAARRDPSLRWWWEILGDLGASESNWPAFEFESQRAKEQLGETGGATSVDFFVDDGSAVICCECKWVEDGFGCSCPSPTTGECRPGIYNCDAYWETAGELFNLPKHSHGTEPCRLSFAYQAVRNVAAALKLAGDDRTAVFALVYNAANPYFGGHGQWPGWASVLNTTLEDAHPRLEFRARSWQELVPQLPLDGATRAWASEKHGLD